MSDDLVKRLRALSASMGSFGLIEREAADAIERLTWERDEERLSSFNFKMALQADLRRYDETEVGKRCASLRQSIAGIQPAQAEAVAMLESQLFLTMRAAADAAARAEAAEARVKALEEALRFYADADEWNDLLSGFGEWAAHCDRTGLRHDHGETARAALEAK